MRILLTGCGGQVGLELIEYLLQQGEEVVATDIVDRPAAANQEVPWHHLDVTDGAAVMSAVKEYKPDSIYHLAAILSAAGEAKPDLAYAVNQVGTHNVLEACRAVQWDQDVSSVRILPQPRGSRSPESS